MQITALRGAVVGRGGSFATVAALKRVGRPAAARMTSTTTSALAGPEAAAEVVLATADAPPPSALLTEFSMPICPFCQRVDTIVALKGQGRAIRYVIVDLSVPRPDWLLAKTGFGAKSSVLTTTMLPVLELPGGRVIKESMLICDYLDAALPGPRVAQTDPLRRATEQMLVALAPEWIGAGYTLVMNTDRARRDELVAKYLSSAKKISAFLDVHAEAGGPFLFGAEFGYAEAAFAPFWQRFQFLEYYEGVDMPEGDAAFARARAWRDACLAHPAVRHITHEEVVKLYYDYARGAGNGALLPGRARSSFALEPRWQDRPMPPANKYETSATDAELGLA
jgi:glutathione S-transferase